MTSYRYRERELLEELRGLGAFERTGFRDVVKGEIENLEIFLRELERRRPISLSRVVPAEKSFQFSPDQVVKEFSEAAKPFIERIGKGESFCVKVERRGLKGSFSSQQVATEEGTFISKAIEERDGVKPRVDLQNPDKAIIFVTLGRWCGVGIVSKEMRKKYSYLKLR